MNRSERLKRRRARLQKQPPRWSSLNPELKAVYSALIEAWLDGTEEGRALTADVGTDEAKAAIIEGHDAGLITILVDNDDRTGTVAVSIGPN